MLLVVSSAVNLAARYGVEGAMRLRDRIEGLTRYGEHVIFPDDPVSAARYHLGPLYMTSPPVVAQTLWTIYQALGFSSGDALLLVGGNAVVPFAQLPNPAAGGSDSDMVVLSDNPYGFASSRAGEAFQIGVLPDFSVGRLPDSEPPDLEAFLALLDHLSSAPPAYRRGTFAVVNKAWLSATEEALEGKAIFRTTPPWSATDAEWRTQDAQLLYFNLHGFNDRPEWRGFDDWSGNWYDAVRPADVVSDAVGGTIVFAENCYGGLVSGRSARDSVALAMLAAGARAFVGSTALAYGSFYQSTTWPIEADLLGEDFVHEISLGQPAGQALQRARLRFFSDASPEGWEAFRLKTTLEFVLYGNPLATL